ncbi:MULTISPECIES: LexA family protein [unclassified Paenibacillus]|uniref:LexA family protein n=1 Tax=unclassified Paenibacillus TaxID=185978 RepID=UPI003639F2D4
MDYYESLSKMINSSGLTLKEIAEKCFEYGVKITPSYISKLQSTRQAPASDDVNVALAKVCQWNVENFLYESYLEKSPILLQNLLNDTELFFRQLILQLSYRHYPTDLIPAIRKQQDVLTQYEIIKHILNNKDDLISLMDSKSETIESEFTYELGYTMSDDSMAPIIQKDALLQIEVSEHYKNGEFVVCLLNNKELLVRRYIETDNNIILVPENKKFSPEILKKNDVKVLGKIKSISIIL